jgi:hypothetical protein
MPHPHLTRQHLRHEGKLEASAHRQFLVCTDNSDIRRVEEGNVMFEYASCRARLDLWVV